MNIFKKAILYFRKPYYFPRKDFRVFTQYKLSEEFDHLEKRKIGYVHVTPAKKTGYHNLTLDVWQGLFSKPGYKPRRGDVWVTTSKDRPGELMSLVFTTMNCFYDGNVDGINTADFTATAQCFGFAGDLLQIEKMKEHVINGGKMKPVVLS